MKKRALAMLLAAVMLFGVLAGCGKDEKPGSDSEKPGEEMQTIDGKVYQPSYLSITCPDPEPLQYINYMAVEGERAFFTGSVLVGTEPVLDEVTREPLLDPEGNPVERDKEETRLYAMDLATGAVTRLSGYTMAALPEGKLGSIYVNNLAAQADGTIWIVEEMYTYSFNLPEDFNPEVDDAYQYYADDGSAMICKHLDASGELLSEMTLEQPQDGMVSSITILRDGTVLGYDWANLYRYDETGKIAAQVEMENANTFFETNEGKLAATTYGENGMAVIPVDTEAMTLGEAQPMEKNAYMLYDGSGDYAYYYDMNGTIFGVKADGTQQKLVSWLDCDVDSSNLRGNVAVTADGTIYDIESQFSEMDGGSTDSLVVLRQVDASTVPQKEVLTMACVYMNWDTRSSIVNFNKSQDKVRIQVRDYSEFSTEDNPMGGIQKLNTELMSGVSPDLFYLSSELPTKVYGAKGFFMDLWPMIENDPDLGRDALMTHFFDVISQDGKLYEVTDRFSINTATTLSTMTQGKTSWTLDELMEVYRTLPEGATIFGEMDTKESVLATCVFRNLDSFIDWEARTSSFDSQEFVDLLTFANSFPMEFDEENFDWASYQSPQARIMAGKQLLMADYIMSFDQLMSTYAAFGGKPSYIGYPTTGSSGSTFQYYDSYAIGAKCKNPEAAWTFVRQYLTEEHHEMDPAMGGVRPGIMYDSGLASAAPMPMNLYYFPTNRAVFEKTAKDYMTEQTALNPETGEEEKIPKTFYWPENGEDSVPIYAMSQAEYDLFMDLYNSIETASAYNEEISKIIMEECGAMFGGQKTPEQTAKVIQDRVGLYIMEQG